MDPHSRLHQFNNAREPKIGPSRRPELPLPKPSSSLAAFTKASAMQSPKRQASPAVDVVKRPIATNSRVKQDEKYRNELFLAAINTALQTKSNGVPDKFNELVRELSPSNVCSRPPAHVRGFIQMLCHVVSRLDRTHSTLVEALVRMPWTVLDAAIVKSYTVLMGMLLSARPEYLSLVLSMVAQGFTYYSTLDTLDPTTNPVPVVRSVVYDRLHYLLNHLLSIIPTLPSTLMPLLSRHFPHKRQSVAAQSTYIRNLLRISDYCPEVSDRILTTIIDRAITIDVEIQVELDELEADEDEPDEIFALEVDPFNTVFGQEEEEEDSDDDDSDGDSDILSDLSSEPDIDLDDTGRPEAIHTDSRHIQAMVKKLDTILEIMFQHLMRSVPSSDGDENPQPAPLPELPPLPSVLGSLHTFTPSPSPPPGPPDAARASKQRPTVESPSLQANFNALIAFFDRTILLTFKSRYTQFILFWLTSLDADFADIYLGMLIERALLDDNAPPVTRATAALYIGSFVSRAQFVERDETRRIVGVLCDWLSAHVDDEGSAQVFYAVAQSLFIIFCFRWRELQDADGKWIPALSLMHDVLHAPLAPLRMCSRDVSMQFAKVAQITNFAYVHHLLKGPSAEAELSSFFPFEPYRLPKSKRFVEPIFREWAQVKVGGDSDDEDEEEDEEEEEDELEEDLVGAIPVVSMRKLDEDSSDGETMGLGFSLDKMSISPLHGPIVTGTAGLASPLQLRP